MSIGALNQKNDTFFQNLAKRLLEAKSEKEIERIFSERDNDKSSAQKLYSVLKNHMEQDMDALHAAFNGQIDWKSQDIVNYQSNYISQKTTEFFSQIDTPYDLSTIFYDTIEKQKVEKQKKIKDNLTESGNTLWHFSKHDINIQDELKPAGCPNYPRDQFVVGVFAVPSDVGTYNLRSNFPDSDFYLDQYALLYTDEKLDMSKVYGYGYRLDASNFTPTVSNDGVYAGEWTSPVAEKITEKIPVTLNHIMDKGCTIYCVSKENEEFVKQNLKGLRGLQRQEKIEELCQQGKINNLNLNREKSREIDDKQEQMSKDWKVHDALGRARKKVYKKEADNSSSKILMEYKNEPYKNKKEEVGRAWEEHENTERTAKAQADKLTAKQIKEFMQNQND